MRSSRIPTRLLGTAVLGAALALAGVTAAPALPNRVVTKDADEVAKEAAKQQVEVAREAAKQQLEAAREAAKDRAEAAAEAAKDKAEALVEAAKAVAKGAPAAAVDLKAAEAIARANLAQAKKVAQADYLEAKQEVRSQYLEALAEVTTASPAGRERLRQQALAARKAGLVAVKAQFRAQLDTAGRYDGKPQVIVLSDPVYAAADGSGPVRLVATATSGLPVAWRSLTPVVCTVTGSTATPVTAGSCAVEVVQTGNGTYAPAEPVTTAVRVALAAAGLATTG